MRLQGQVEPGPRALDATWTQALGSPETPGNFQNDRFIGSLKDLLSQKL